MGAGQQVIASLTDNSSNMVAAFLMPIQDLSDVEKELEEDRDNEEQQRLIVNPIIIL